MAWRQVAFGGCAASVAGLAVLTGSAVLSPSVAEARAPNSEASTGAKLKQVQVVFRHGARTPLGKRYWPKFVDAWDVCGQLYEPVAVEITTEDGQPRPVNTHDAEQVATRFEGGCSKGELTLEGQLQAREYGRWLRRRYVEALGFLPASYEPGSLLGRTTNYSRTVATLRGVLTGLYPDARAPFPVHTTEEMDEIMFGNAESCQRLAALIKELASTTRREAAAPTPDVQALQVRVKQALGLQTDERVHFLDLHDAMTTMRAHGKPIPGGMQDAELLRAVEHEATRHFLRFVVGDQGRKEEMLRLGMGRLMALLLQRMEEAARAEANKQRPKIYLYSGHDSTIMPLLAALGKDVDHWPPYLSNLVFEQWESPEGEAYVKVLYNREELPLTELCGAGACSLQCLRDTVLKPFLQMSKEQQQEECLLHFSHDKPAGENVKEVIEIKSGSSVLEE